MFGGAGRYLAMKEKAETLPHVEVTKEEFIELMVASGVTREKADSHATICKIMGSHVMIGEQMVAIKK